MITRRLLGFGMTALLLASPLIGQRAHIPPPPMPFCLYYGWIPHTPAAYTALAQRLQGYPVVVLGSGDEWAASGDEGPTHRLIQQLRSTQFYGYVDIGVTNGQPDHSLATIQRAVRQWARLGIRGVLLDCAGPSYGVSLARLRASVAAVHANHLRVLINAFTPAVALHADLRPGDAWLAENWVIQDGQPVNATAQGENRAILPVLRAHHIAIWMTATDNRPPTAAWVHDWAAQTIDQLHGQAIAVAGPHYSSVSNAVVPAAWVRAAESP